MIDFYDAHVIWLPGWCVWFFLALWFVMALSLAAFFMRNQPKYGPADELVASAGPSILAMIISAAILIGMSYLFRLAGFELGFKG